MMKFTSSLVVGLVGVLTRSNGFISDGFRWCDVQHQHHLMSFDGFPLGPGETPTNPTTLYKRA